MFNSSFWINTFQYIYKAVFVHHRFSCQFLSCTWWFFTKSTFFCKPKWCWFHYDFSAIFFLNLFENGRREINGRSRSHGLSFVEIHQWHLTIRVRTILDFHDGHSFRGLFQFLHVSLIVVGFLKDLHLILINTIEVFIALTRFYDHIHSFIVAFWHCTYTMHEGVHNL